MLGALTESDKCKYWDIFKYLVLDIIQNIYGLYLTPGLQLFHNWGNCLILTIMFIVNKKGCISAVLVDCHSGSGLQWIEIIHWAYLFVSSATVLKNNLIQININSPMVEHQEVDCAVKQSFLWVVVDVIFNHVAMFWILSLSLLSVSKSSLTDKNLPRSSEDKSLLFPFTLCISSRVKPSWSETCWYYHHNLLKINHILPRQVELCIGTQNFQRLFIFNIFSTFLCYEQFSHLATNIFVKSILRMLISFFLYLFSISTVIAIVLVTFC